MSATAGMVPFDVTVPNVARIYDCLLDGKDNYEADRRVAAELLKLGPHAKQACHQNRAFLGRVVRYLMAEHGIRQFIDIGSGLPTMQNTHEIARAADPGARVVYVDNDVVAVAHGRVLLAGSPGVLVLQADLRSPAGITGSPEVRELIDFSQPAAILLFAILHFITDDEQPYGIVRSLTEVLAPGSALAISHTTHESISSEGSLAVQGMYRGASAPVIPRLQPDIARFFDGLELIEPGVTDINLWPVPAAGPRTPPSFYGGVALKP
jgi:S-adenosyl methyltransferase